MVVGFIMGIGINRLIGMGKLLGKRRGKEIIRTILIIITIINILKLITLIVLVLNPKIIIIIDTNNK